MHSKGTRRRGGSPIKNDAGERQAPVWADIDARAEDAAEDGAFLKAYSSDKNVSVLVFDETDSTNIAAKRLALDGFGHGAWAVASRQSRGRGRLGRSFLSPPGGLYMSVVLTPPALPEAAALVTAAAAVAMCRAVSRLCEIELSVKWVNDLFWQGKKCCGILAESSFGAKGGVPDYLVVGLGLNYTTPLSLFPPDMAGAVTSLFPQKAPLAGRAKVAAACHSELLALYDGLCDRSFLPEYRKRSMVIGRKITVLQNPAWQGTAIEIDRDARLVVRREGGGLEALSYGEISIQI